MFFWPLQSLVPLWQIFASPSFPDHVGICLSRFERFFQVIIAFTGWHEWCTCVLSSLQEMIWCECRQIFRVITYSCQGSCVECLFHKTHCCAEHLVGDASVVQDSNHDFLATFQSIFPRFHQSEELREDWITKKPFSVLNHSQSYLCPIRPWMLSVPWLLQRSSCRCRWWWSSGSHVLQWTLSQQLDMARCPMTVWLRCVLLWLSGSKTQVWVLLTALEKSKTISVSVSKTNTDRGKLVIALEHYAKLCQLHQVLRCFLFLFSFENK